MNGIKGWLLLTLAVCAATAVVVFGSVYITILPADELPPYHVKKQRDDTLRVVMIGDSWAMFHYTLNRDSVLHAMLSRRIDRPVKVMSRGKGGANSKEIYYYMFASETIESEHEADRCTQPLLEEHPDYCLLSAGINDAGQGKGPSFYCQNVGYILRLLLHNGIRPVVMELPTVVIDNKIDMPLEDFVNENRFFARSRLKKRLKFKLAAWLNRTDLNKVDECRDALRLMLEQTGLMDSVIYIRTAQWNPDGYKDKRNIYLDDGTHLNMAGYDVLDSCYAAVILRDYGKRRR